MKKRGSVFLIATIAAIGGLLFGYDTGVISGALIQLKYDFELSSRLQEWVTSIVLLGACSGAIFSGKITDLLGRKKVIIITAAFFGLGAIGISLADSVQGLILWRLLIGIAVGVASYTVPLYISEIAPSNIRGALVSMNQLAIAFGIFISYMVNLVYASTEEGWRWMFFIGFIPSAILGFGMIFLPETPRWLLVKGNEEAARKVLMKIGEAEGDKIVKEIKESLSHEESSLWENLKSKWVRPALIIAMGIMFIQQFTGINTIIYYSPTIFEMAGFGVGEVGNHIAAVIKPAIPIGIINVVFTIVAMFLIDRWGRKPLLYLGLTGMVISLILLGFSFTFYNTLNQQTIKYVSLGSMLFYAPFFSLSLGPIAWLLISEVFPTRIRGVGMAIATLTNWVCNFLMTNTFLSLGKMTTGEIPNPTGEGGMLVNPGGAFLIYAVVGILGIIFIRRYVPETKGCSLEEIENGFLTGRYNKA